MYIFALTIYRGSPLSTNSGIWKKSYYAKFVLVGTTWPISNSTKLIPIAQNIVLVEFVLVETVLLGDPLWSRAINLATIQFLTVMFKDHCYISIKFPLLSILWCATNPDLLLLATLQWVLVVFFFCSFGHQFFWCQVWKSIYSENELFGKWQKYKMMRSQ